MELNLYNINEEMAKVRDLIYQSYNEETGEFDQELANKFNELKVVKENKIQGCIYTIKKFENNVELIDKEIERLKGLKEKAKKVDEKLRNLLLMNIETGKKYDFGTTQISWRKSESVNIDNMEVPKPIETTNGYFRVKTTYTPDKAMIKDALKNGGLVEGAKLESKENMQIK